MTVRQRKPAQILALFAISLVGLLGALALVLDGGTMYVQRRYAQTGADAAAVAGAYTLMNANSTTPLSSFSSIINSYVASNSFGATATVTCAYFVGTDGVTPVGNIINENSTGCATHTTGASTAATPCTSPTSVAIPCTAAGVSVSARAGPYNTYLLQIANGPATASIAAHAASQVGALTGMDSDLAPLAACGDDQPRPASGDSNVDLVIGTDPGPYTLNTALYGVTVILQWSQLDKNQDDDKCPHTSGSSWKGRTATGNDGDSNDPDIGSGSTVDLDNGNPSANVTATCTATGQSSPTTTAPSPCKLFLPLVRKGSSDDVAFVQMMACFEMIGDLNGASGQNWHGILRANNECPPYGTYNNTGWTLSTGYNTGGKVGLTR